MVTYPEVEPGSSENLLLMISDQDAKQRALYGHMLSEGFRMSWCFDACHRYAFGRDPLNTKR